MPANEVESAPTPDSSVLDWRTRKIVVGAVVLFPRRWGKAGHSTEMVEGRVLGFSPKGNVRVRVLRTSRPALHGRVKEVCAAPVHSISVIS
ncbi:hypothetical protein [Embleya sp. NBC_00896]|uniref:hypothetical protein n=1 Tax=Embleya sp. NBC_00896 TaxID=2975961 RepID=UPI00386589B7|nr:hypothetical protein OG928_48610 [Embleya sp. NBC_00896]